METSRCGFWELVKTYRQSKNKKEVKALIKENQEIFTIEYHRVHKLVSEKMDSPEVTVNGGTPFTEYVGADDGHDDLTDYIIWNGQAVVDSFLADPKFAIPLAKRMSKNPGFSGDTNILRKLVYEN